MSEGEVYGPLSNRKFDTPLTKPFPNPPELSTMKNAHLKTGLQGEDQACRFMEELGYLILQRNWRFGRAEVDLICGKERELVFIEVKTRSTDNYGDPELFVGRAKQKKMKEAALAFTNALSQDFVVRFDIIAIIQNGENRGLLHLENAFQPKTPRWQ